MQILTSEERRFPQVLKRITTRAAPAQKKVEVQTKKILRQVKEEGDRALIKLTRQFDRWAANKENLLVSPQEMREAWQSLGREEIKALELAASRIAGFHSLQKDHSWSFAEENGNICGQVIGPLERVGIYVPGGKAAYPSSVLMNAIPAQIAGVPHIIMATPAFEGRVSNAVLAAAAIGGVKRIFKIGGAQAVGALAYGTKTVPKVDKIVGPGNIYVAMAKKLVSTEVGIDSIAGPSEILIIADGSANPSFIAADLISQAEHDEQAAALLVCLSRRFAEEVRKEINQQLTNLPRREIAAKALKNLGAIIVVKSMAEAIKICNEIAPEHLELAVADPFSLLKKIRHAGSIFLGHASPEAIGDYVAGPNHVLPTGGTARFYSPLGVYDFQKRSNFICLSAAGLRSLSPSARQLANLERLAGHEQAIILRVKDLDKRKEQQ